MCHQIAASICCHDAPVTQSHVEKFRDLDYQFSFNLLCIELEESEKMIRECVRRRLMSTLYS